MVQGEEMEKKNIFPAAALFLAGFFIGMLIPNLSYRFSWKQQAFSAIYLLNTYGKQNISGTEYLRELLQLRGAFFFLALFCGFTVFGVPVAVMAMLFAGIGIGMVFSMSILQFGLAGGAVAIGLLFPQYVLYLPVWGSVYELVYKESRGIWRNHGIFPGKIKQYLIKSLWCTILFALGILLEWYVNPWILRQILSFLNFF